MVLCADQGAVSLMEVPTLPLPKEPWTHPPQVTGGISAGYELTVGSMDDDQSDL